MQSRLIACQASCRQPTCCCRLLGNSVHTVHLKLAQKPSRIPSLREHCTCKRVTNSVCQNMTGSSKIETCRTRPVSAIAHQLNDPSSTGSSYSSCLQTSITHFIAVGTPVIIVWVIHNDNGCPYSNKMYNAGRQAG